MGRQPGAAGRGRGPSRRGTDRRCDREHRRGEGTEGQRPTSKRHGRGRRGCIAWAARRKRRPSGPSVGPRWCPREWLSLSSRGSCRGRNAPAQKVEAGSTLALPLDQLEPGDPALGLAAAPRRGERGADGRAIESKPGCEGPHGAHPGRARVGEPGAQIGERRLWVGVAARPAPARERGETAGQRGGARGLARPGPPRPPRARTAPPRAGRATKRAASAGAGGRAGRGRDGGRPVPPLVRGGRGRCGSVLRKPAVHPLGCARGAVGAQLAPRDRRVLAPRGEGARDDAPRTRRGMTGVVPTTWGPDRTRALLARQPDNAPHDAAPAGRIASRWRRMQRSSPPCPAVPVRPPTGDSRPLPTVSPPHGGRRMPRGPDRRFSGPVRGDVRPSHRLKPGNGPSQVDFVPVGSTRRMPAGALRIQ